jgi:hypothetical protein
MYIYQRPHTKRYFPQLGGISGDNSKPAKPKLRIGTYWANDFSKGCKRDARLSHSDDLARGFARAMVAQGHQWAVDHDSSHASPTDWLSFPDNKGIPFDNSDAVQGADTTDFAYLVTHGAVTFVDKPHPTEDLYIYRAGFGLDAPQGPEAAFKFEATSPDKFPRCLWFNNKSRLGDKRLRWLVVDACESLQLPGWVKSEKMTLEVNPQKLWHHAFDGLNMVFGFTGYSSDAWWTDLRGAAFGRRAGAGQKLTEAWLDEAYSWWVGDKAVALACGHNEADATHRLRFDRVTAPFVKIPHDKIGAYAWEWRI